MGALLNGIWHDEAIVQPGSAFVRKESQFRNFVSRDGGPHPAEAGRYHLYVSLACPWAHRTLIMRAFKNLEEAIPVSSVHWLMGDKGWTFDPAEGVVPDSVNGASYLYEIYTRAVPDYSGRVTVPVLWDKVKNTIVNNESAEILRMLNSEFAGIGASETDFYPEDLREEIDAINDRIYRTVNNGVYRAGFATTQDAYEEAVYSLFETLDWLEARMEGKPWLVGSRLTEADIRLFTTLVRFDSVYHGHFKCNVRRIVDYPNLSALLKRFYELPKVADTVNMTHIKNHYYRSHGHINPNGIVPIGPAQIFE